jgi:hypothetical protein
MKFLKYLLATALIMIVAVASANADTAPVITNPQYVPLITGWTTQAFTPFVGSPGYEYFIGQTKSDQGHNAWGDITVYAQEYISGSWQSVAYACFPSSCGTTYGSEFATLVEIPVNNIPCGRSIRTYALASVLLTGGWQYTPKYSSATTAC